MKKFLVMDCEHYHPAEDDIQAAFETHQEAVNYMKEFSASEKRYGNIYILNIEEFLSKFTNKDF